MTRLEREGRPADVTGSGASAQPRSMAAIGVGSEQTPRTWQQAQQRGDEHGMQRDEPSRERVREDRLEAFAPPLPALLPPAAALSPPSALARAPGSAFDRAQTAALAEQMVVSMQIGRFRRGVDRARALAETGYEMRLRLDAGRSRAIDVKLRHEAGTLSAELAGEGLTRAELRDLADTIAAELEARGVRFDEVRTC